MSTPASSFASAGGVDGFVVKFNPTGDVLWAQQVLGSGTDAAYGVAVDAVGTSYVTGIAGSNLFIGEELKPTSSDINIFFAKFAP